MKLGGSVPHQNTRGSWKQRARQEMEVTFATAKPSELQMEQLSEIADKLQCSCGKLLVTDDHHLSDVFVCVYILFFSHTDGKPLLWNKDCS